MRSVMRLAGMCAAAFAVGNAHAATVNIVNPGFESHSAGYPYTLDGWTVEGPLNVISVPAALAGQGFDGSLVVTGGSPYYSTTLTQQLGTIQAGTYTLTVSALYDGIGGAGLYADTGLPYPTYFSGISMFDRIADSNVFSVSVTVAADSNLIGKNYGIKLAGYGSSGEGNYYDNVSVSYVSSVPEPASAGLMLAGLGVLGAATRRRRAG